LTKTDHQLCVAYNNDSSSSPAQVIVTSHHAFDDVINQRAEPKHLAVRQQVNNQLTTMASRLRNTETMGQVGAVGGLGQQTVARAGQYK